MPSGHPANDPFETLKVEFGATDAEIAKAYRQLARTLHPDKLTNATAIEQERAAKRFQELQVARAFLLEPEFLKEREKYLAKRASQKLRRETDAAREAAQSDRRKRLRRELQQQEVTAKKNKPSKAKDLAAEGQKLRDQLSARATSNAQDELATRQVRLKWSRKKLSTQRIESPSEDSLAKSLSEKFGKILDVLMIGSKGNLALVTFAHKNSCDAIVTQYADSDCWRATYVSESAKKHQREKELAQLQPKNVETVDDWQARRNAAREQALRQMEGEDQSGGRPYPPPFPPDYVGTPIEMLEMAEAAILKDILTENELENIKVASKSDPINLAS